MTVINLIHHSDRSCQYASSEYVGLLQEKSVRISMTESGDPKDNAQAERINNTMKDELLKGLRFSNIEEVRAAVARAVDFHNNEGPHMSIDIKILAESALCVCEISKCWISYRENAIRANQGVDFTLRKSVDLPLLKMSIQSYSLHHGSSYTDNKHIDTRVTR